LVWDLCDGDLLQFNYRQNLVLKYAHFSVPILCISKDAAIPSIFFNAFLNGIQEMTNQIGLMGMEQP
jgi:hypothetical protein